MGSNWYDNFSGDSSKSNNISVMFSTVINGIKQIEKEAEVNQSSLFLESFVKTLRNSKNILTPELKEAIDNIFPSHINSVWGSTEYSQKTPIGHAIDNCHTEALEYLLKLGADVNIPGSNQQHVLQELLASNATDKRIKILELVLENLEPGTVKVKKGFDGKYYSIKYLTTLINSTQLTESEIEEIYEYSSPKQKTILIEHCKRLHILDENMQFSTDIRELFLI
jgi:hypothetical protein